MASIIVRQAKLTDIEKYEALQSQRWRDENQASHAQLLARFKTYPEGMLVAEEHGEIVGMVFAMRIAGYDEQNPPSWYEITHDGMCDNHVPNGPIIFGVDLTTAPGVGGRAGEQLLIGIGQLAINHNIAWCMLGGRLPGYHAYKDTMTAEEYLWSKTPEGRFLDKQVSFYSKVPGLRVIKAIPNYFDDPASDNYGVLLKWRNPFYNWPLQKLWSRSFPLLFSLEEAYLAARKRLKSNRS